MQLSGGRHESKMAFNKAVTFDLKPTMMVAAAAGVAVSVLFLFGDTVVDAYSVKA